MRRLRETCTPTTSRDECATSRMRFSRVRTHGWLAVLITAALVLLPPAALHGQKVGHSTSAPSSGPFEEVAHAGIGALMLSPHASLGYGMVLEHDAAFAPSAASVEVGADIAQRDTSAHHGSRAHHAVVGALIGAAVGTGFGIAADRPWLGVGESRHGHFNNLWLVTTPLGALVGATVGAFTPAD